MFIETKQFMSKFPYYHSPCSTWSRL